MANNYEKLKLMFETRRQLKGYYEVIHGVNTSSSTEYNITTIHSSNTHV